MSIPADRTTFASLAAQTTINAFVYSTYLARLPDIRDQAGISTSALGALMTAGNVAGLLGTLLAAPLLARFSSKAILLWGGPVYVLTLPVIGGSSSPLLLLAAIMTMMVANAVVDVALAMQQTVFSARRGRPVLSRLSGLYSLGTVGGGVLATVILASGIKVTIHLLVLSAVLVAGLTVVGRGLLPTDDRAPRAGAPARERTRSRRRWTRPLLFLFVASAVIVPLDVVPGEWATFRMTDDLDQSRAAAAFAYFAFTAGMTLGRLGGDHAAVAIGRARLARLATTLSVAGLAVGATAAQPQLVTAGFFLAGLGASVLAPLLTEAAGHAPGPPGAGLQALFVGNRLAGLITPVVVGSIAGTAAIGVGTTMLMVVIPCAVAFLVLARLATRGHPAPVVAVAAT